MNAQKGDYFGSLTLVLIVMSIAIVAYAVDDAGKTETSEIQRMVGKIKAEPNSQQHYVDSLNLEKLICETPLANIGDRDIDLLIAFVKEGNDDDRATGAEALASVGPKASRAVPALQEALEKSRAYEASLRTRTGGALTGMLSTDIIKQALGIITGDIHKSCRRGNGER